MPVPWRAMRCRALLCRVVRCDPSNWRFGNRTPEARQWVPCAAGARWAATLRCVTLRYTALPYSTLHMVHSHLGLGVLSPTLLPLEHNTTQHNTTQHNSTQHNTQGWGCCTIEFAVLFIKLLSLFLCSTTNVQTSHSIHSYGTAPRALHPRKEWSPHSRSHAMNARAMACHAVPCLAVPCRAVRSFQLAIRQSHSGGKAMGAVRCRSEMGRNVALRYAALHCVTLQHVTHGTFPSRTGRFVPDTAPVGTQHNTTQHNSTQLNTTQYTRMGLLHD
mmetsp:Transcript_20299/g.56462  ORF Transcript_20299/g.56462 Transcript_20299/m.56462 type:complete len:274 (-) Transcript_20299:124-945(-)